jgi:integrase
LPDDPTGSEFLLALEIANRGDGPVKETPKGETLAGLIHAYQASNNFRSLASNSRSAAAKYLSEIGSKYGATPLTVFNNRKIRHELLIWRDEIAHNLPATAEVLFANFRRLLSFGLERGILEQNILAKINKVYESDRSEIIWSESQVTALLNVANPYIGRVVKLALHTGQRQGDLLRWRWTDCTNGSLWLRQGKTLARVYLPIGPSLQTVLDECPRSAETILTAPKGKPWKAINFRAAFVATMREAGLGEAGLHFHDFRGTAITIMADAGMSEAQIAAVTGHSLKHVSEILKKYLKRTDAQAKAGMGAIEQSWVGKLHG